jgi:hypothetical protein
VTVCRDTVRSAPNRSFCRAGIVPAADAFLATKDRRCSAAGCGTSRTAVRHGEARRRVGCLQGGGRLQPWRGRVKSALAACSSGASWSWCPHGRGPNATRRHGEVQAGRRRGRPQDRHDPTAAHVPPRSGPLPEDSTQRRRTSRTAVPDGRAARIRATACPNVSDFDGRPSWPAGASTSVATLRRTLSLASACLMARVSPACVMDTVRVARVAARVFQRRRDGRRRELTQRHCPDAVDDRNGSHRELDGEIHIASDLVGDTGIEPVTSSV